MEKIVCDCCGKEFDFDDMTDFGSGVLYCEACAEDARATYTEED